LVASEPFAFVTGNPQSILKSTGFLASLFRRRFLGTFSDSHPTWTSLLPVFRDLRTSISLPLSSAALFSCRFFCSLLGGHLFRFFFTEKNLLFMVVDNIINKSFL